MNRWMKWIAPVAGLALLIGFSPLQVKAQDAPPAGKATVTVTVVDSNAKPVEGARVVLLPPRKKNAKPQAAIGNPSANQLAKGAKGNRPKPIAEGTTDKDGKAVLTGVPDGEFVVHAMLKGTGMGHEKVTVTDGKDVSVTVTLKEKHAKP
jgi:hypothetical protein